MNDLLNILVVEDEATTRRAIDKALAGAAMTIRQADCGIEAIRLAASQSFDCVLLDYHLPDDDGISLLKKLRDAGVVAPMVLLTGRGDEKLAVQALKAGAADYLAKSQMTPEALEHAVRNAVRLDRLERSAIEATQRLRANEQRLARILETNADGILILDQDGRRTLVNRAAEQILGRTRNELLNNQEGDRWTEAWEAPLAEVVRTASPVYGAEVNVARPDGARAIVSIDAAPLMNGGGQVKEVIASLRDVTAIKQTHDILRQAAEGISGAMGEAFLQSLVRYLAEALGVTYAIIGELTSGHPPRVRSVAVYGAGKIVENIEYDLVNTPCEHVVGADLRSYPSHVRQLFPNDALLAEMNADSYMGMPLFDTAGHPLGLIAVMDLRPMRQPQRAELLLRIFAARAAAELQRLQSDAALRASEERYRRVAEINPAGICHTDFSGAVLYANSAMREMMQIPPDQDLSGLHVKDFFDPQNWNVVRRNMQLRCSGVASTYEVEMIGRAGRRRNVVIAGVPITDAHGQLVGTVGNIIDITERKQHEADIREAEERYRLLFEQSPHSIVILDPSNGRVLQFNTAAHQNLGFTREEFAGLAINDVEAAKSPAEVEAQIQKIIKAGHDTFETRLRSKSGEIRDVLVTVARLNLGGKTVLHSIAQDITDRTHLREQLLQSQKMEAVGRLAGGVAHDFNNLLAIISGYSEAMLRRLAADDPLRAHAAEIVKAAERGGSLTRQLLTFSRRQHLRPTHVDVNLAVAGLRDMLQRVMEREISIVTDTSPSLPAVFADQGQIEQVVLNLALNARDAMPEGGQLVIQTRPIDVTRDVSLTPGLKPGPYVRLSVSDTGIGMDEETRRRIFEPFFTTKGKKGTGLGLSIVYGIVQQYGGHISVESSPAAGTRFDVLLPCASPPEISA